jgi:hypothetical protein
MPHIVLLRIHNDGAEDAVLSRHNGLLLVLVGCGNSLPPSWRDRRVLHRANLASSLGGCNLPRRNQIAEEIPEEADCVEGEPKRTEDQFEVVSKHSNEVPEDEVEDVADGVEDEASSLEDDVGQKRNKTSAIINHAFSNPESRRGNNEDTTQHGGLGDGEILIVGKRADESVGNVGGELERKDFFDHGSD